MDKIDHMLEVHSEPEMKIHFIMNQNRHSDEPQKIDAFLRERDPHASIINVEFPPCSTVGYNRGEALIPPGNEKNEILVFIHRDARLHFDWNRVLPAYFKALPRIGVLGFAGTSKMTLDGRWWMLPAYNYGGLIQGVFDPKTTAPNLTFNKCGNYIDLNGEKLHYQAMEAADGYCLIIRRDVFQAIGRFDESFDHWHLYDSDLCMSAIKAGYQNYIIDQLSQHWGYGSLDANWAAQQTKFKEKWYDYFRS